jgi:HTH-type transcriptional regulator/antitoxin HigA
MLESIQSEKEYKLALSRAYELMQINLIENSTEHNELGNLSLLINNYEQIHYPFVNPSSQTMLSPTTHQ